MAASHKQLGEIRQDTDAEYYLTISSGGTAAVLGGLGALLGCYAAGIKRFRMLGGVSGGSIISSLAASGLDSKQLLHLGMELDFGKCVSFWGDAWSLLNPFAARRPQERSGAANWRITGLYGTDALADFLNNNYGDEGGKNNSWPASYWTMATTRKGEPVVIKSDGVHLIGQDGKVQKLSDQPPSLATAVRMSCTIPGVISAFRHKGYFLFDGALSRWGICPVGLQVSHFGCDPHKIIACHINEDSKDPLAGRFHSACRFSWGVTAARNWGPETAGIIEFSPHIQHVHTLKFNLSREDKWLAILIGFESCVARLALEGILSGENLNKVRKLMVDLGYWRNAVPAELGAPQPLADRIEACLRDYQLF